MRTIDIPFAYTLSFWKNADYAEICRKEQHNCINIQKQAHFLHFLALLFRSFYTFYATKQGEEKRQTGISSEENSYPTADKQLSEYYTDSYPSRVRLLFVSCPTAVGLLIAYFLTIVVPFQDAEHPTFASYNSRFLRADYHLSITLQ